MSNQAAAITVDNLHKSYKKVDVLKGVSFTVDKGSVFALLGANGAGKTTTINILTTLLGATSGTAIVNGSNVSNSPSDVRKHISLTGQFAAVDDILTGRENLELIADLRHVVQPKKIVNNLLAQFDLEEAADRRALTYSGGMRRRLDIAMSLIGSPSIIFFDEPTTGLDPQSRNDVWETIRSLAANGTTIFLTTQYLEEADQLADMICILDQGKIVAQGAPEELKKLLPHGQVELQFPDETQLSTAAQLLKTFKPVQNIETFSLSVKTDGTVTQLTQILTKLEKAHVEVTEFSQKSPSLDDVFLKVINQNKEKK